MVIFRDEERIARMGRIAKIANFVGLGALIIGFILAFANLESFTNLVLYQLTALGVGWLLSQIGIYLTHRYLREPRPDQVLDDAVKKVARNGRMYHFLMPAPHVLLTPEGIIVFNLKYQMGQISVEGNKWKQRGVGLRKFFGQEGLGNPTREVEVMVEALANFIRKNAPNVEEVPIGAMIVFTTKGVKNLDVNQSSIPAMHATKVKGFLRQQRRSPLPEADYEAIKAAFDAKASHLVEEQADDA
jgi:hypothetical protein